MKNRDLAAAVAAVGALPMPIGDLLVYRAGHGSISCGLYTTVEAAQQHCEALISREYPADVTVTFDWLRGADEGDFSTAELVVRLFDGPDVATGYTVTPLEVATAYDLDADE